jgi:hypothetical protein
VGRDGGDASVLPPHEKSIENQANKILTLKLRFSSPVRPLVIPGRATKPHAGDMCPEAMSASCPQASLSHITTAGIDSAASRVVQPVIPEALTYKEGRGGLAISLEVVMKVVLSADFGRGQSPSWGSKATQADLRVDWKGNGGIGNQRCICALQYRSRRRLSPLIHGTASQPAMQLIWTRGTGTARERCPSLRRLCDGGFVGTADGLRR